METKEILRMERGITLVALIITIIVLIILAAVSINAVLKTDFIGLATNGTINYAEAQVNEQEKMEELDSKLDSVIAEIEKVSSPKIFTNTRYWLEVSGNFERLCIDFFEDGLVEILQKEINNQKNEANKMTDEEILVKLIGYNGTFKQYIEEEYNAGNLKEKYSTIKEVFIKEDGMTEAEAEAEIANMRQEYQEYMDEINNIDINNINTNDIKIIKPTGEKLDYHHDFLPIEVRDYIYQIEYLGIRVKMKVSIKPYELVNYYSGTNSEFGAYALDVKNKRYLTIKNAKVNIDGNEINVGSEYLVNEDSYNYLATRKVYDNYAAGILTRAVAMRFNWVSLICNEGIIEGYARG